MFALSYLGRGWMMSMSYFPTRRRLGMAANLSWVCTFQVGATDTGGAPSGSGLCSKLNCLPLCAIFN